MPHRRIQMTLIIDTVAHARTIRDSVKAKLNSMNIDIFKLDADVEHSINIDGVLIAFVDVRWKSTAKANEFRDWVKDRARNSLVMTWILSGSKAQLHTCTHADAVVVPCVVDEIWSKP